MKNKLKLFVPCFIVFLLFGCELNNTPTSKVEERLSQYQMMDESIDMNESILLFTDGDNLTESQEGKYEKIIKKQYQSMAYEVKNEMEDGDTAIITVEIEVVDYKTVQEELDRDVDKVSVGVEQYHQKRIESFQDASDKVIYTIEFYVSKDSDGNWSLDDLNSADKQKLLGIY